MRSRVRNVRPIRQRLFAALPLLCLFFAAPISGASDDAGEGSGFEAFRILVDRNIFNRNRIPAPRPGSDARAREDFGTLQSTDRLSLVGALIDEFGAVAFFSGSKAEFQGVTKQGDSIAGFTIEKIESERIVLKRDGVETVLAVGASMEREEGGTWQLRSGVEFEPGSFAAPRSGDSIADSNSDGNSADEVRRRMIERRKQEAKR